MHTFFVRAIWFAVGVATGWVVAQFRYARIKYETDQAQKLGLDFVRNELEEVRQTSEDLRRRLRVAENAVFRHDDKPAGNGNPGAGEPKA